MEEEFYATIKLVTGEELVSKVCYMPDEDSFDSRAPSRSNSNWSNRKTDYR